MSAAKRDGQPEADRDAAQVRQEHPEDHQGCQDGRITFEPGMHKPRNAGIIFLYKINTFNCLQL